MLRKSVFVVVLVTLFFVISQVHANEDDFALFTLILAGLNNKQNKVEKSEKKELKNAEAILELADLIFGTSSPRPSSSSRSTSRPTSRPATSRPSTRPSTRPSSRPASRPTTRPSSRPATRPTARPSSRPSTRPSTGPKPSTRPSTKPSTGPKPSTRPATRPTTTKPTTPKPTTTKPSTNPATRAATPKPAAGATKPATPVRASAADQANKIIQYEGRFDKNGNLKVYKLPSGDGGGTYEVAGINDRYHPKVAAELKGMIERGEHAKARSAAASYLAKYTDGSASMSKIPAIQFYLRDSSFNRGPTGARTILNHALGLGKGTSSQQTAAALKEAEKNPSALLTKLRQSREWYERNYAKRDESSKFWKGLVNRWNNAEKDARAFGFTPQE